MDPVSLGKRDDLEVCIRLALSHVLGWRFQGIIEDHCPTPLLSRFEAAGLNVTVNSPARDTVTFCVFINGKEDIGFGVKDSLGFDGFKGLDVLFFRKCLSHIVVIG